MKNIMLMQINIYFTAEGDRRLSEGRVDLGIVFNDDKRRQ